MASYFLVLVYFTENDPQLLTHPLVVLRAWGGSKEGRSDLGDSGGPWIKATIYSRTHSSVKLDFLACVPGLVYSWSPYPRTLVWEPAEKS